MKNLVAKLFITLVVVSGLPNLGLANTTLTAVSNNNISAAGSTGGFYRIPEQSIQTHQVFLSEGLAQITIRGDGDTDLDLYVYDSYGQSVQSDRYGDYEVVTFKVNRSGYFTVKVINRGRVYNDYRMYVERY